MTALCGGGTSGVVSGIGADVILGGAGLTALVIKRLGQWAQPYLGFIGNIQLSLTTYCATDPPAMPSDADIATALISMAGFPIIKADDAAVLIQAIEHVIWSDFCQCSTGVIPTPPTPIAAPSGVPQFNPGIGTSAPQAPCWNGSVSFIPTSFEGYNPTRAVFAGTPVTIHDGNPHTGLPGESYDGVAIPVPPPTSIDVTLNVIGPFTSGIDFGIGLDVIWYSDLGDSSHNGTEVRLDPLGDFNAPGTATMTIVPPPGGLYARIAVDDGLASSGQTAVCQVSSVWTCSGALTGVCCPSGPDNTQAISQILQLLTLIQRQLAPFAYVDGAAHAGLTGDGSFSVSGIVGLKVDLTTTPTRVGGVGGVPETIFDVGWINLGTSDGYGPRVFISSDPMIVVPVSPLVTTVGYSIPADVVLTITELDREP